MRTTQIMTIVGLIAVGASRDAMAQTPSQSQLQVRPEYEGASGAYALERVNDHSIPARSWTRKSTDVTCSTEMRSGTLVLDSKGRWVAYTTERDRCEMPASVTKRHEVLPEVSTLSTGAYSIKGDAIELRDEVSGVTHTGTISASGDVMSIDINGTGALAGQKMTYVVRRLRQVR